MPLDLFQRSPPLTADDGLSMRVLLGLRILFRFVSGDFYRPGATLPEFVMFSQAWLQAILMG